MNLDNITALDIPVLQRLDYLIKLMNTLTPIAQDPGNKVNYQGKTWCYEDLLSVAYEYYALGRNYGLNQVNLVKWLDNEQAILSRNNLPWPLLS